MAAKIPRTCPVCTTRVPEAFPAGLCPKCLLSSVTPLLEKADAKENSPAEANPSDSLSVDDHSPTRRTTIPSVETLRRLFPELEILGVLGVGGMGAVYRARQPRLDRLVALKVMVPPPGRERDFALRFEREAQVLALLNHPNIVILHDFGEISADHTTAEPLYWFLMEYVDGTDLSKLIKSKELIPAQALAIVPQICDALQYAHDKGITHRDIKPSNILIGTKGTVKIADFGLAKMAISSEVDFITGLTMTGTALGTPQYMAPEIWDHPEQVDHRADIYALGVVLYEMLTGERPAGAFQPPSRRASGVDSKLDSVVSHAMEKDPARRYQQAVQVKEDVTKIYNTTRTVDLERCAAMRRRYITWGTVGFILILIACLVPFWKRPIPSHDSTSWQPAADSSRPTRNETFDGGNLKSQGSLRRGLPIDLTKAEGITNFTQVFLHDYGWVALRSNGQTVSSDGRGERSDVAKICPGLDGCFALIDPLGKVELVDRSNNRSGLQGKLPQDVDQIGAADVAFNPHHSIALLRDGSARVWGNHYDNPKAVPEWMGQEHWARPPVGALSQVVSIAITPMSASTITSDGKLWTWGASSVAIPADAEALQGEYDTVISSNSGLYDARTKNGRVTSFNLSMRDVKISAPMSSSGVFGSYRPLHQRADGQWFTLWNTPSLQPFLDTIHSLPSSRFSLMTFHEGAEKVSIGLIQIQEPES